MSWTTSTGAVTGSGSAVTFKCTTPGSITVTVAASDSDSSCNDTLSFDIGCTP